MRFSLFTKIMLWFFLNLLILGAILLLIFNFRFDARSSSFLRSSSPVEAVTRRIESETSEKSRAECDEILRKYSEQYAVEFYLFDNTGRQLCGRETALPAEVFSDITRPEPPFPGAAERQPNPDAAAPPRPPRPPRGGPPPSRYLKTTSPATLYWFIGRTLTFEPGKTQPTRTRVLAASPSYTGGGLFFDPTPFVVVAGVIIGFSTLFWLPFVRRITKTVSQLTRATAQIAEENFAVRVDEKRTDELGRLGEGINHLARRLSGFVNGQKRFLGDISHELNSPLARMQFALSILEDRVDEKNRAYVEDVKEEVELMSKLVGELLEYSKAGIKASQINLEPVALRPLLLRLVERETNAEPVEIKLEVDENLNAMAQPELLSRALANVIRNAVRYARHAGEILVKAEEDSNSGGGDNRQVKITVADKGAGVPPESLEKLFDPFYRIESDRSRQTGGTGLGLAIVKTCVEACRGKVSAENLSPQGFAINILLKSCH